LTYRYVKVVDKQGSVSIIFTLNAIFPANLLTGTKDPTCETSYVTNWT